MLGELKKILAGQTGLNPQDQKLIYKEKERDSKVFLDVAGVKNGSKLVLVEDELSKERRFIESRKTAKMEKASKDIAEIRFQIDNLAKRVKNFILFFHCVCPNYNFSPYFYKLQTHIIYIGS